MPKVTFDFFQVQTAENTPQSFNEVLDHLSQQDDKSFAIDGITYAMIEKLHLLGYDGYLFTKIRMDDLPQKTRANGQRAPLALDEDEGLGEDIAFAYSPALKIIALQRNRYAFSANTLVRIISSVSPELELRFLPILRTNALQRFFECNLLKKLRLKLSGTHDLAFLRDSDLSPSEKITFQEMLTEPYVDITFSVGRQNVGLTEKLRRIATFFAGHHERGGDDVVLAVEITGKQDGVDTTSVIDLLQDRLIYVGEVNRSGRTINTDHLMRVACSALQENYAELRTHVEQAG